jgi:hypothetical protein
MLVVGWVSSGTNVRARFSKSVKIWALIMRMKFDQTLSKLKLKTKISGICQMLESLNSQLKPKTWTAKNTWRVGDG